MQATLGTRDFSRVRREFSALAEGRSHERRTETGNGAKKDTGTQGTRKHLFHGNFGRASQRCLDPLCVRCE